MFNWWKAPGLPPGYDAKLRTGTETITSNCTRRASRRLRNSIEQIRTEKLLYKIQLITGNLAYTANTMLGYRIDNHAIFPGHEWYPVTCPPPIPAWSLAGGTTTGSAKKVIRFLDHCYLIFLPLMLGNKTLSNIQQTPTPAYPPIVIYNSSRDSAYKTFWKHKIIPGLSRSNGPYPTTFAYPGTVPVNIGGFALAGSVNIPIDPSYQIASWENRQILDGINTLVR